MRCFLPTNESPQLSDSLLFKSLLKYPSNARLTSFTMASFINSLILGEKKPMKDTKYH